MKNIEEALERFYFAAIEEPAAGICPKGGMCSTCRRRTDSSPNPRGTSGSGESQIAALGSHKSAYTCVSLGD